MHLVPISHLDNNLDPLVALGSHYICLDGPLVRPYILKIPTQLLCPNKQGINGKKETDQTG